MTKELEKKIEQAVKLIQSAGKDGSTVEVAYSGGKDSDVILELTKMSGIKYRVIYKNTTIDPPGTIKHAMDNGAEILRPNVTFFHLIEKYGYPSRFIRHCCGYLKEYKVLDRCIMGIRKCESSKRNKRYNEPTGCRYYGSKDKYVEVFYPILDWSDSDVVEFIRERSIRLHPLYYREDGSVDPQRRLGCMCCPLISIKKRKEQFKQHPKMVRAYIRAGLKYFSAHKGGKTEKKYKDIFTWFFRDVFCEDENEFNETKTNLFGDMDYKAFLEEYFNVKLDDLIKQS